MKVRAKRNFFAVEDGKRKMYEFGKEYDISEKQSKKIGRFFDSVDIKKKESEKK